MALNSKAIGFMEASSFEAYSDTCISCRHSTFVDCELTCSYLIVLDPYSTVNESSKCNKFESI